MELRALKSFRYDKVRLQPGDMFQAKNDRDLLVLTLSLGGKRPLAEKVESSNGKAEKKSEETKPKEASRIEPEAPDNSNKHDSADAEDHTKERAALRVKYENICGKKPFPGWNAEQLREKIKAAEAK